MAAVGADHFRVGVTLHNQARARIASGDLATARSLLDRSAAILEPALGREHPRWQVWRTSDAEWRLASGGVASALAALREASPAPVEAFGADSREASRAPVWSVASWPRTRCRYRPDPASKPSRSSTSPRLRLACAMRIGAPRPVCCHSVCRVSPHWSVVLASRKCSM